MLEVLGDDYIMQHINNELYTEMVERSYREYVTDILYLIAKGGYMKKTWSEILEDATKPPERRSAEEIKNSIKNKINGR